MLVVQDLCLSVFLSLPMKLPYMLSLLCSPLFSQFSKQIYHLRNAFLQPYMVTPIKCGHTSLISMHCNAYVKPTRAYDIIQAEVSTLTICSSLNKSWIRMN